MATKKDNDEVTNADAVTASDLPTDEPSESDTANAPGTGDEGTPVSTTIDESIFSQGFLTEDAAWDAIGDADDSDIEVVPEGTAFKIVRINRED